MASVHAKFPSSLTATFSFPVRLEYAIWCLKHLSENLISQVMLDSEKKKKDILLFEQQNWLWS